MTRLLTADYLIIDRIITLQNPTDPLSRKVQEAGVPPGGKAFIDRQTYAAFNALVRGMPEEMHPGGSSANTLVTLMRLMQGEAQADFIGMAGQDEYGAAIRASLAQAGIRLHPAHAPQGVETAVSFVFVYPQGWQGVAQGERVVFTYEGNARAHVTPAVIREELAKQANIVLVQGALWRKFDPPFADTLVRLAHDGGKKLILTLPSRADAGAQERFQALVKNADIVACNEEELHRVFPHEAALQAHLKPGAAALVTRGAAGASLLTATEHHAVPPPAIRPEEVVNTLGAGDTALAGFIAGWLRNRPLLQCAEQAMRLAGAKLKTGGSRLEELQLFG